MLVGTASPRPERGASHPLWSTYPEVSPCGAVAVEPKITSNGASLYARRIDPSANPHPLVWGPRGTSVPVPGSHRRTGFGLRRRCTDCGGENAVTAVELEPRKTGLYEACLA